MPTDLDPGTYLQEQEEDQSDKQHVEVVVSASAFRSLLYILQG